VPNNASAKKRVRQTGKRRFENRIVKTRYRGATKRLLLALDNQEPAERVESLLSEAYAALDKAAKKGAIHKNQASRRKSRLASRVKALPQKTV